MPFLLEKSFTRDRTVRTVLGIVLVSLLILALTGLRTVLVPFALAFIFAYVLLPFVRFVQYKLHFRYRLLSVITVFLLLVGLVILLGMTIVPAVEEELGKTWDLIMRYTNPDALLNILPRSLREHLKGNTGFDDLFEDLSFERIYDNAKEILSQLGNIISGTFSVMSWVLVFLMGVLYFFFILNDYEALVGGFVRFFPPGRQNRVRIILADIDSFMNSYFRGQSLIALCVGILLSVGYKIYGLPLAVTIGMIIGCLNFVPYMQILGVPPLIFLAALKAAQTGQNFFVVLVFTLGILMIVQIIQDTVLTPHIMGKQMGMRPSLILLSISIWGSVLGFLGLIVALPFTMALYSIYMRFVIKDKSYIRQRKHYRDEQRSKRLAYLRKNRPQPALGK